MNELISTENHAGQLLLVHGMIVLFAGVLSGIPFWLFIILKRAEESVKAWRVTHSILIAYGLLMLVLGLICSQLALSGKLDSIVAWLFVVSGYGFVFAFVVGALVKRRGLTPWPLGLNTVLFAGHFIGATGSFLGIVIVIFCLFRGF